MKKILVTAGTVYGRLDDNKLVGNRVRGIWATKFARWLQTRGHDVVVLIADIQKDQVDRAVKERPALEFEVIGKLEVITHTGFWDYEQKCLALAPEVDAAVMAAAVVNWIPETPFVGKMPTEGVAAGSRQMIPFILAPHVIDKMKKQNKKLTLIGCKMTIGKMQPEDSAHPDGVYTIDECPLFELAYKTLLAARCNVVIANDMKSGLKQKYLVYQDRAVIPYNVADPKFFQALEAVILDEHFRTKAVDRFSFGFHDREAAAAIFDMLVDRFRRRFKKRLANNEHVFGAVAVRLPYGSVLVSPREKDQMFSSKDAVVARLDNEDPTMTTILVEAGGKASLNAPLLIRHLDAYPEAAAVVHFHEELVPTLTMEHAPPGTVRDNLRAIPAPIYSIAKHGCIIAIGHDGLPLPWTPELK